MNTNTAKKTKDEYLKRFNKSFYKAKKIFTNDNVREEQIKETKKFLEFWLESNKHFVACCVKDGEEFYTNLATLDTIIENIPLYLNRKVDVYFSTHKFFKMQRKNKYCCHINGVVLDLDYLHAPTKNSTLKEVELYQTYRYYTPQMLVNRIENIIEQGIIPAPTAVVSTGRGIALYYKTKNQNAKYKQKIYKKIIDTFYKKLANECMDKQCVDLARVVRIPNSWNTKANGFSNFAYVNYNNVWNSLEELFKEVDLEEYTKYTKEKEQNIIKYSEVAQKIEERKNRETEQKKREKEKKKKAKNINKYFKNIEQSNIPAKKVQDIETLINLRYKKQTFEGYRSVMLLYYAYNFLLANNGNMELLENKIKEINKKVKQDKTEIKNVINAAHKAYLENKRQLVKIETKKSGLERNGYNYKNSTIITLLGISIEEMAHLKYIKTTENKETYREIKRQEWRIKNGKEGEEITKSKKEELEETRKKIKALKIKGLKNKEIAASLNLPVKTVERHITFLKKQGLL